VAVTIFVPVDAAAGVAPAGGAPVDGAVAAVELLLVVPDTVEPEDVVPSVPVAAAIPKTAARNPPIDRRAAATLARLAGWRRRVVLWS
jgi:hypothetical protein